MKRPCAAVILIAFNFILILAQQTDQSFKPTTTAPAGALTLGMPPDVRSLELSKPPFTFGQSQTKHPVIRPTISATEEVGNFVVMNGAVYMHLPWDRSLVPISGGGASGCFSLDLPKRISSLNEFIPRLDHLEQIKPQAVLRWADLFR